MQTYLFYDIETTGLNKAFDQVLHFAAIRTDLSLQELDRYEIKIKLNPDVIPSPYALITHKMGIKEISEGTNEFTAITQIHQWLNEPGTISLGYNTLGFDDEFLRFSFYRNLLKPYTHQYANQCSRMDIFPMTVMYFLFKNNVIHWPLKDEKISLKLEEINAANQLISGRSHHAMVDVEVTLELARRLLQEKEMWDYLHGYFRKDVDNTRMQQVQNDIALLVNSKLGKDALFHSPVLFLGTHRHYTNQSCWLRLDTEKLSQATEENFIEHCWVTSKKLAEPNFILPFKERFLQKLSAERIALAKQNHHFLQAHPALYNKIVSHYTNFKYPTYPNTDIDASLYLNGFWSSDEEIFCYRFHKADVREKSQLLDRMANPKLYELALRILGKHYPDVLTGRQQEQFNLYLRKMGGHEAVMTDHLNRKRMTPEMAMAEITQLRGERKLDALDEELLLDYEKYLQQTFSV